ncbi:MAG: hypothetical protein ND807_14920 [Vicinamibacterales bacterium]|nr:hypothetical protein [Vicinamibacterales bacterium]
MRPSTQVILVAFLVTLTVAAEATSQPLADRGAFRSSVARALDVRQGSTSQATKPRNDSLLNGLLIGAGIGAALGLIPDYYDDCEECHDSLYASIAVGAGIGLLVDALRTNRQPVSPSISRAPIRFDVAVKRRGIGVRTKIHWR